MKNFIKKVYFKANGTSIGCYDSDGYAIPYLLIDGEPFIRLDKSVDRLVTLHRVAMHNVQINYYSSNVSGSFGFCTLAGVINGTFVSSKNAHFMYAERPCSNRELASFYLARYKAKKNAIKLASEVCK